MDGFEVPLIPLEEARKRYPPVWTIYDKPTDYPEHIVVRIWWGMVPDPDFLRICDTLEDARTCCVMSGASWRFMRHESEDPKIVESWV